MDVLDAGQAWLSDQLTQHAARDVIYRHKGVDIPVRATLGRTTFEQTDDSGAIVRFESRDFLIDRASLVLEGHPFDPDDGDTIRDSVDTLVLEYEVLSAGTGTSFRNSDPFGHKLRIHTKKVRVIQ